MTDTQEALRQVSEALRDEALFDPGASTADTYNACKAFGTACSPENIAAILAHVEAQAAEIDRLTAALRAQPGPVSMADVEWAGKVHLAEAIRERDELRDVLLRDGFVPCDIPACNCGSWHHRYGLPERMRDIEDTLAEAGHELSNANGNLPINALKALVAERDELRRQLDEAERDARRYRWLRANRQFCAAAYPDGEWAIPAGMVFLGPDNPNADAWIDAAKEQK